MLHYCKKCGRVLSHPNGENCSFCKSILYPVPEKYWLDGLDFLISNESKTLLREELVKTSPEFDQYLFDHREEILAKKNLEYDMAITHGKAVLEEKIRVPKCPTCGSSNISKIGTVNRMVSTGLFGLASSKIGKTHKCNNCGYTW